MSRAVSVGFIVEVWRRGIPALTSSGYGPGVHLLTKFDDGSKAVSACSIPLFCTRVRPSAERRQRTPHRRSETDRNAQSRVVERLDDISGQALESIDVAPRGFPAPEIGGEFVRGIRQRLQELLGRHFCTDVVAEIHIGLFRRIAKALLHVLAPEHGQGSWQGRHTPT